MMSFLNGHTRGDSVLLLDGNQGPHNSNRSRETLQLENKSNMKNKKIVFAEKASTCLHKPFNPPHNTICGGGNWLTKDIKHNIFYSFTISKLQNNEFWKRDELFFKHILSVRLLAGCYVKRDDNFYDGLLEKDECLRAS